MLDVFAGIGGMSQGFIQAGFYVKWAVEKDITTAETFEKNHQNTYIFKECVYKWFLKVVKKSKDAKHDDCNPYVNVLSTSRHLHLSPVSVRMHKEVNYDCFIIIRSSDKSPAMSGIFIS